MKFAKKALAALSVITIIFLAACASRPRVTVVELENKGTAIGVSTPDWVRTYVQYGVTRLQAQSEYRDRYCVVGEETGANLQFVVAWADNFSAQQRIGAMLRTTIATEYQARVQAQAQSVGGGTAASSGGQSSGFYQQEIDSVINAIVSASYSGAQREGDWWSLRRRYDPDVEDVFTDEYTAYVIYTIPKAEMNRQVAMAMETAISADSALYDITIAMARQLMEDGITNWGE